MLSSRSLAAWLVTSLLVVCHAAQAQDIKVGVIAGMSGGGASYGASLRQGIEMAMKEINDAGGIKGRKLVFDVADDASDPAQSVLAMQRLVNDQVSIVVGGWGSSQVLANMEVAERAGMPYIVVGASNPRITTSRNKWTFRILSDDNDHAKRLADLATGLLHMKQIAVISDSNDYGVGLRDVFVARLKQLGVTPVDVESYQTNDKDFTAQLTHIAGSKPDGIAVMGTLPAAPAIMNQARDLGIDGRFIGAGGLSNEGHHHAGAGSVAAHHRYRVFLRHARPGRESMDRSVSGDVQGCGTGASPFAGRASLSRHENGGGLSDVRRDRQGSGAAVPEGLAWHILWLATRRGAF